MIIGCRELFSQAQKPFDNFQKIFQKVSEPISQAPFQDPTAMVLSTVSSQNRPSSRVVLLKEASNQNFVFYTNYHSKKAHEILVNPQASLLFFWPTALTQIRIEGTLMKTSRAESENYFATRPRISQLGAWASHQSAEIATYSVLEEKMRQVEAKFQNLPVPCPENWGGYSLSPDYYEFWFAMEGRLHQRYSFQKQPSDGTWRAYMMSP